MLGARMDETQYQEGTEETEVNILDLIKMILYSVCHKDGLRPRGRGRWFVTDMH